MNIYCINHSYKYELEKLSRLFLPLEDFKILLDDEGERTGEYLYTKISENAESVRISAQLSLYNREKALQKAFAVSEAFNAELELARLCFYLYEEICGFTPSWGILTGVRPSKLMMRHIEKDGEEAAEEYFKNVLLVSPEKTALASAVAKKEKSIIDLSDDNSFSLYVSIPFCPTRCSYCSFVSHSIGTPSAKKLVPEYVDAIKKEIKLVSKYAKENSLSLKSVYWGGGTPTTLEADGLDEISAVIEECFDFSDCLEYTVEAGRPDTVTREKLEVLKKHGVTRISINPQSFNDSVLSAVKRNHTVKEMKEKFFLARSLGFDNINTDLIAGLPTDTLEGFCHSIDEAIKLSPENITVHTLALKRSSEIVTENESGTLNKNITDDMIKYAEAALYKAGYAPYYMYRQSKSLGNLENVGWCKPGRECFYNVFMMEECHTILSVGAGAVTKLVKNKGEYIERIFNHKYPFEYISRFSELCERKKRITEFYSE